MSSKQRRPVDIFCATFRRAEKLRAMIDSVRATGYPARVCVAAGDLESVRVCEEAGEIAEAVYSTEANRRIGCTAPLNHVYRSLVRRDALFCTDDCVFEEDSLEVAMSRLYEEFPDGDGVVGLCQANIPDGYPLAFPLFGRAFLDRFAHHDGLFFPGYFHLYNDAEMGITAMCLGNWVFEPRARLRHFHPICGGGEMDSTHHHALTHERADWGVWIDRRVRGVVWGIDESAEDVSLPAIEKETAA